MATWQFDLFLLDGCKIREILASSQSIDRDLFDSTDWWTGATSFGELSEFLDSVLSVSESWDPTLKIWGDMQGNRIDVSFSGCQIEEVSVRIDARDITPAFLNILVNLCSTFDLMILTSKMKVIEPTAYNLKHEIEESPERRFTKSPLEFIQTFHKPGTS